MSELHRHCQCDSCTGEDCELLKKDADDEREKGQAAVEMMELLEKWAGRKTGIGESPIMEWVYLPNSSRPTQSEVKLAIRSVLAELRTPEGLERIRKELEQ